MQPILVTAIALQQSLVNISIFLLSLSAIYYLLFTGWGAIDRTGEQSRYPRQVDLTYNKTTDCNCSSIYFLQTNVGPEGQDPCEGDSGQTERFSRNKITIN